jgi:hypothetical protein
MTFCCISYCDAERGGVLYSLQAFFDFVRVQVQNATADYGGGLEVWSDSNLTGDRCNFTNMDSTILGAACRVYSSATLQMSETIFNLCSDAGQAICCAWLYAMMNIRLSLFVDSLSCFAVHSTERATSSVSDSFLRQTLGFRCDSGTLTIKNCYFAEPSLLISGLFQIINLGGHKFSTTAELNPEIETIVINCEIYRAAIPTGRECGTISGGISTAPDCAPQSAVKVRLGLDIKELCSSGFCGDRSEAFSYLRQARGLALVLLWGLLLLLF